MNGPYLPPSWRCSAYWYAAQFHSVSVPLEPGDLEFLRELGLRAASLARWEGIPAMTVPEGPWPAVYLWPEHIWSTVANAMAQHAAEHGDYGPETVIPPSAANARDLSCDRCNYDRHRCKGCGEPLPHGREICPGCDDAWGGRGPSVSYQEWRDEGISGRAAYESQLSRRDDDFWSYPAPPEDTQAYVDWCQMADAEYDDAIERSGVYGFERYGVSGYEL